MGSLSRPAHASSGARGYTLVELLVVLIVLGILASIVALKMHAPEDAALHTDADRLAALFSLAADEAQVRSRTITFEANDLGYRFLLNGEHGQQTLDDEHFRQRRWSAPSVTAHLLSGRSDLDASDGIAIAFPVEGVQAPFTLDLSAGSAHVDLAADGLGHYRVVNADAQP